MLLVTILVMAMAMSTEVPAMGNKIARLCEAIKEGNNEEAIKLAEGIRDLNAQSSDIPWLTGFFEAEVTTPLVKACETGNEEMISWLLEHGAATDYAPGDILYPLETFCENGTGAGTEALRQLLEYGADPDQYKKRPPLFRLAQTLRHRSEETYPAGVDMVMMLLEAGARWQDPTDGFTILHYAAMQRDGKFLEALLEMEAAAGFLNTENDEGLTPLDLAEKNENGECLQLLREALA